MFVGPMPYFEYGIKQLKELCFDRHSDVSKFTGNIRTQIGNQPNFFRQMEDYFIL
jgi:hypothetical protein